MSSGGSLYLQHCGDYLDGTSSSRTSEDSATITSLMQKQAEKLALSNDDTSSSFGHPAVALTLACAVTLAICYLKRQKRMILGRLHDDEDFRADSDQLV